MHRRLFLLLTTFLFSGSLYGQDAVTPPPEVKRILEDAVAEVKKNRQEFDKANEKPIAAARERLQELVKKLVDDGKSEEAAIVLKQIGTVEQEVLRKSELPSNGTGKGKTATQKPLLDRVSGKWKRGHNLEVDISGTSLKQSDGHTAQIKRTAQDVAVAVFAEGWRWQCHMVNEDMIAVKEWSPKGEVTDGLVLERIK